MDISLKSFVSEDQIEQKRKIRQQFWEQNRTADQPLECPEEEYDPRTLYERLKEQKDKKQDEYEESKKLKHCIKLLDNDEVEFLEKVDEQKLREMQEKLNEEKKAVEEFKKRVANLSEEEENKKLNTAKKTTKRQAKLLQNAIKRKASGKESEEDESNTDKRRKNEKGQSSSKSNDDGDKDDDDDEKEKSNDNLINAIEEAKPAYKVLGILPGLACYVSDSSNTSDSDNEEDNNINSSELDILFIAEKSRQLLNAKKKLKKLGQ